MTLLELTKATAQQYEKLEGQALKILQEALDEGELTDVAVAAVKILNVATKNRITTGAMDAIRWSMAQTIGDEKELRAYIRLTQPRVSRALKGKTE